MKVTGEGQRSQLKDVEVSVFSEQLPFFNTSDSVFFKKKARLACYSAQERTNQKMETTIECWFLVIFHISIGQTKNIQYHVCFQKKLLPRKLD